MTFTLINSTQGKLCKRPLLCLLDSGSTSTWINNKALLPGITGKIVTSKTGQTMAGTFKSSAEVTTQRMTFPEFHWNRSVNSVLASVFCADCCYDIIAGHDVLRQLGMQFDFENHLLEWDGSVVAMREYPNIKPRFDDVPEATVAETLVLELVGR